MTDPKIADTRPTKVNLTADQTYAFCSCGHSGSQPFCDGSHKGVEGGFAPKVFTAERDGDAFLCMCKHTQNAPFCDGSHKGL